jgi:hypothetical protein
MVETFQLGVSILVAILLLVVVVQLSDIKERLKTIDKEINNWRYHI